MRILHVIPSMHPDWGGPPIVAACLGSAQAELGHSVRIVCHESPGGAEDALVRGLPGGKGVRVVGISRRGVFTKVIGGALRRDLRPALSDADAVHLHGVWPPICRWAAVEARQAGTPYVVTVHGHLDPWSLSQKALKKRIALALAYRNMLDGATCVHAHTEREAGQIRSLGITAPAGVVPNGVFPDEFASLPARGAFRARHPALGENPFVLFMARMHYKKGLDLLAQAFELLAGEDEDVRLVAAGPPGDAEPGFRASIERMGLVDRVVMPGPVYGRDKLAAMADASCFCLPSRQEGFSIAIVEAMAARLPVVLSTSCYFPQAAEAGGGIETTLEPESIASGLRAVLSDPKKARAMGESGRELVMTRFTWPRIAPRLVELYLGNADRAPTP